MNPSTQTAAATHSLGGSIFNSRPLARSIVGLLCCAAVALSTSGCATTRFGALIPGHARSEKIKGELVTAQYIRIDRRPTPKAQQPSFDKSAALFSPAFAPVATELASLLAGVAVDTVKQELIREAKRYEHQSSARLMLTTDDLGEEGVIVVTRWIDGKAPSPNGESTRTMSQSNVPARRSRAFPSRQDVPAPDELIGKFVNQRVAVTAGEESGELGRILNSQANKRPAEVLTLRVRREGASSVYRISGAKLWVAAVGAKVVKFGWGNLPQFWQWPGALLLKSDSQVEIEATVNIKSLMVTKDSEIKWAEVKPESGVLSSVKVNLNEAPKTFDLGNNVGAWLAVPMVVTEEAKGDSKQAATILPGETNEYAKQGDVAGGTPVEPKKDVPKPKKMGFVVMDFKLNERDTSNASKYLEDAAKAVEKNRGSIVDGVTKAFE